MGGKALKRPAPPAKISAAAQFRQRALEVDDPLRQALALLQLRALPGSIAELHRSVSALHPRLDRTWNWQLVQSYQLVFATICRAKGDSNG